MDGDRVQSLSVYGSHSETVEAQCESLVLWCCPSLAALIDSDV